MDTPASILLVDDDIELTTMLARYLVEQRLAVRTAANGQAMDAALESALPDVIVLDLMLPGEDGLSLARKLRERYPALPVLMLSARCDTIDRVLGLEMGADDYIGKPFDPRELLARIRAVLRRTTALLPPPAILSFGEFRLDAASHSLTRRGVPIALTTGELTLLHILLRNRGRVLTRDQLAHAAQGEERLPFERGIDVRIARIRKKVEDNPLQPHWIRTVWGTGYLFTAEQ